MTSMVDARRIGDEVGEAILAAVGDWQTNAPRTQQSASRQLGMSEMGGCREYIRATIAGEPKAPPQPLKWAAFVGTATGDFVESILSGYGFVTQEDAFLTLPRTGITVQGHLDARGPNKIIDLKTRDGLAEVRREGPSFKEKAQISGYLIAKLEEPGSTLDEDATGHLVYLDRSGKTPETFVWSVTVDQARIILDAVEERLLDVAHALETASRNGRDGRLMTDEPESYCYAISCPFYSACWAGYTPTQKIEHPRQIDAVRRLVEARAGVTENTELRDQAREDLRGVEGVVDSGPLKGTVVRWTLTTTESGRQSDRLDVRTPKV